MVRYYAEATIAVVPSVYEGFGLPAGEAMACGVPCVATDVGDSAFLLGDTGEVVPPRDPGALAAAWERLLSMPRDARLRCGEAARRRIAETFDLQSVVERYRALYTPYLEGVPRERR